MLAFLRRFLIGAFANPSVDLELEMNIFARTMLHDRHF